jgi:hypothetical protein
MAFKYLDPLACARATEFETRTRDCARVDTEIEYGKRHPEHVAEILKANALLLGIAEIDLSPPAARLEQPEMVNA